MAIVRVYQPPAALIGEVARLAGQGQFAQAQDEFNAQNARFGAQLNQQADQFAAQRQDRQQAAVMEQQRYLAGLQAQEAQRQQEMAYRAAMDQQNFLQQSALQQGQQAFQAQQQANQQAFAQQADTIQFGRQQALAQQNQEFQYGIKTMDQVDSQVDDMIKFVRELELDPRTGAPEAAKMFKDIQAVRENVGKLRPQQYAEAMGQVLEKYGGLDWQSMSVQQPTPEEEFWDNAIHLDNGYVAVKDGRGGWRMEQIQEPGTQQDLLGFEKPEAMVGAINDLMNATKTKKDGIEKPGLSPMQAMVQLRNMQRAQGYMAAIEQAREEGDKFSELKYQRLLDEVMAQEGSETSTTPKKSAAEFVTGKAEEEAAAAAPSKPAAKRGPNEMPSYMVTQIATDTYLQNEGLPTLEQNYKMGEAEIQQKGDVGVIPVPPVQSEQIINEIVPLTGDENWYLAGKTYAKPIPLKEPPNRQQLLFLAGRWVTYIGDDGKPRRMKFPGRMLQLARNQAASPTDQAWSAGVPMG